MPSESSPTLYLHNPSKPLPTSDMYQNPSYYAFRRKASPISPHPRSSSRLGSHSVHSRKSHNSRRSAASDDGDGGVPKFRKDFLKFHSENGVRTVIGSIGPVKDGMLKFIIYNFDLLTEER